MTRGTLPLKLVDNHSAKIHYAFNIRSTVDKNVELYILLTGIDIFNDGTLIKSTPYVDIGPVSYNNYRAQIERMIIESAKSLPWLMNYQRGELK